MGVTLAVSRFNPDDYLLGTGVNAILVQPRFYRSDLNVFILRSLPLSSRHFSLLISLFRTSGRGIGIESGGMPNRGQDGKKEKDNGRVVRGICRKIPHLL